MSVSGDGGAVILMFPARRAPRIRAWMPAIAVALALAAVLAAAAPPVNAAAIATAQSVSLLPD